MRKPSDSVGRLLIRAGILDEAALAEALEVQRAGVPIVSLVHALGYAPEDALVRVLSRQWGVPGVVLSRSVIHVSVLRGVSPEFAARHTLLPLVEDASRVFVAIADPSDTLAQRELAFVKGKTVVPHVALRLSIVRAIRQTYAAAARGEPQWRGEAAATEGGPGRMFVVLDVDELPGDITSDSLRDTVTEEVTRELYDADLAEPAAEDTAHAHTDGDLSASGVHERVPSSTALDIMPASSSSGMIDLDSGGQGRPEGTPSGIPRVLIVDDDFATSQLIVKTLTGAVIPETAASGMEAVRRLRTSRPDLVIMDVMLPDIDGFRICRSIKHSRKYSHMPVILLSAVIDSGRVTNEVLARTGADAYFEKPLHTDRLRRKVTELLGARVAVQPLQEDGSFNQALVLYRAGQIDEAIETLRAGLSLDPLSARHHFVLANLLQKKNQVYEAIDEYEATINLKADYFPALSRLAYLYYKQGFSAKAIETWRRSLPHCPDQTLRQNIELFMRKLIADMQTERAP